MQYDYISQKRPESQRIYYIYGDQKIPAYFKE